MSDSKWEELLLDIARDADLKGRFLEDPRAVCAERGVPVPEGVALKAIQDTEAVRHIVLPHFSERGGGAPEELAQRASKSVGPTPEW